MRSIPAGKFYTKLIHSPRFEASSACFAHLHTTNYFNKSLSKGIFISHRNFDFRCHKSIKNEVTENISQHSDLFSFLS